MTGPGSNATADARKDRIHESIVELSAPTHAKYPRENTETMVERFPGVTATRRRDHAPTPRTKRDSSNALKKKPEIVRSRAKSTKGGGWRRQPWHVGSVSLAALSGFGTAPTAFQHPMRCIVSVFFVRCKNFFLSSRVVRCCVAFLPQRRASLPGKPHPAMRCKNGGLLPNGLTPCGITLATIGLSRPMICTGKVHAAPICGKYCALQHSDAVPCRRCAGSPRSGTRWWS